MPSSMLTKFVLDLRYLAHPFRDVNGSKAGGGQKLRPIRPNYFELLPFCKSRKEWARLLNKKISFAYDSTCRINVMGGVSSAAESRNPVKRQKKKK